MLPIVKSQYRTIVADPPYPEYGGGIKGGRRGANRHYPLMSVKEILGMADFVKSLRDPEGCHLWLWVTNTHLQDGLDVMKAWGFNYKNKVTWKKDRFGLGQYLRGMSEDCLFGVYGALPYKTIEIDGRTKRAQGVTVIEAPRTEHSTKPDALMEMAELVSYPPRIELFARRTKDGWDAIGSALGSFVPTLTQ